MKNYEIEMVIGQHFEEGFTYEENVIEFEHSAESIEDLVEAIMDVYDEYIDRSDINVYKEDDVWVGEYNYYSDGKRGFWFTAKEA